MVVAFLCILGAEGQCYETVGSHQCHRGAPYAAFASVVGFSGLLAALTVPFLSARAFVDAREVRCLGLGQPRYL